MPEFRLSIPGDLSSRPAISFSVIYGCSQHEAVSLVETTHDPVIVVRGGQDKPATYFIYSWDESTGQIKVTADEENFVPLQRIHAVTDDVAIDYAARESRTG